MSFQAVQWALEDHRVKALSNTALRVLIALADHAHADGTAAWASASVLAERLDVSERSIERAVAALREHQLIRPGDQDLVATKRGGNRPVVWDLDCSPRVRSRADRSVGPAPIEGRHPGGGRADTEGGGGPTPGVGQNTQNIRNTRRAHEPAPSAPAASLTVSDDDGGAGFVCRQCWSQHHPNARCARLRGAPSGWRERALAAGDEHRPVPVLALAQSLLVVPDPSEPR